MCKKVGMFMDASQGVCYTRKDMGYSPPSSLSSWQPQYFVIGGAVAKPNVLQLYDSKSDYEEVVVNMFQGKSVNHINLKAYKLGLSFKCGPCATKSYGSGFGGKGKVSSTHQTGKLFFFSFFFIEKSCVRNFALTLLHSFSPLSLPYTHTLSLTHTYIKSQ
jgi:hypothetical protein